MISFRNQLLKTAGVVDLVIVIASIFHECVDSISTAATVDGIELNQKLFIFNEALYECCRLLRNSCAVGRSIQDRIANIEPSIFSKINVILGDLTKPAILPRNTRQMCWQFVANLCVQNDLIQRKLWIECSASLFNHLNCVCDTECSRECTMILYNLLISEMLSVNDVKSIVELLLQCILDRHDLQTNDFHQLFMEYLIVNYRQIAPVYDRLTSPEKRINFIFYVAEHMKSIRHTIISTPLLQFICKEFKKKSDCVLKTIGSALDAIHPREVIALLEVIARASSDERYTHVLATDRSLFINVGCLLRTIHDIGKQQPIDANDHTNIFAPVQKLTQLAPNSSENSNIERDISYQLKSMLIRLIANLAYKNKSNQDLVSIHKEFFGFIFLHEISFIV